MTVVGISFMQVFSGDGTNVCLFAATGASPNLVLSNPLTITGEMFTAPAAMPDPGGGDDMAGSGDEMQTPPNNTAADDAILPRVLHGIKRGIYQRILQRQREDGKWK